MIQCSSQRRENEGRAELTVLRQAIRSVRDSGEVWSRYIRAIVSLHSIGAVGTGLAKYQ
jgi:hypothetical protein